MRITEEEKKRILTLHEEFKQMFVIKEQTSSKYCKRNQKLSDCMSEKGIKGNPLFDSNNSTGLFTMLYVVKPGDTMSEIVNKVYKQVPYGYEKVGTQSIIKQIQLYNPKLKDVSAIKAGDILQIEQPTD